MVSDKMIEKALDEWFSDIWRKGNARYVTMLKCQMRRTLEAADMQAKRELEAKAERRARKNAVNRAWRQRQKLSRSAKNYWAKMSPDERRIELARRKFKGFNGHA